MKKIKYEEKLEQIYGCIDKVTGKINYIALARNEKDFVRMITFAGYFQMNRITDTEIRGYGLYDDDGVLIGTGVSKDYSIEEIIKELAIEIENKATPIEAKGEDIAQALETGGIEKTNTLEVDSAKVE